MFPRAVAWLRQLVQGLLSPHAAAEGAAAAGRKRKAHGLGGHTDTLSSPVDALHAILLPTQDARECGRKLARVVCTWMQTLPNVRKLMGVKATSAGRRGSKVGGRETCTVLAHLVYIAVLWHLLPSVSQHHAEESRSEHQEEDKKIGDDLQAALLSGALRPRASFACVQMSSLVACCAGARVSQAQLRDLASARAWTRVSVPVWCHACKLRRKSGGSAASTSGATRRKPCRIARARRGRHL